MDLFADDAEGNEPCSDEQRRIRIPLGTAQAAAGSTSVFAFRCGCVVSESGVESGTDLCRMLLLFSNAGEDNRTC